MRNKKTQLTKEFVEQFLKYIPDSGELIRVKTVSHNAQSGSVAGFVDTDGYIKIGVNSAYYRAHRLAWLLYFSMGGVYYC